MSAGGNGRRRGLALDKAEGDRIAAAVLKLLEGIKDAQAAQAPNVAPQHQAGRYRPTHRRPQHHRRNTANASTDRITPSDPRALLSAQENLHDQCKNIA